MDKINLRKTALTNINELTQSEILELILSYSNVQRDTKLIANDLLNKFGSISNIMNADVNALMEIKGLGEVSATFLVLLPSIYNEYNKSSCSSINKINNNKEAAFYFKTLLKALNHEEVFALCLDKNYKVIKLLKLGSGDVDSVKITPLEATFEITKTNPTYVYLSHNHIVASSYPSDADIVFTNALKNQLINFNIILLDHIIISPLDEFSFASYKIL